MNKLVDLLLCTTLIFPCITAMDRDHSHSTQRQLLHNDWKMRQSRGAQWHDATVPGTVQTDLMDNGIIPDPFVGMNEREVQWVDKEDWIYETTFDTDYNKDLNGEVNLVFEGLDTYADVYLNDSLVIKADNMFREWKVPVKGLIQPTGNTLRVYFHSPIKVDMPRFDALPYRYEAVNDQSENGGILDKKVSVFARKAGYHYGWDWGPRLVTSGIWRPVYLESWNGLKIDDVSVRTNELKGKTASLTVDMEIITDKQLENCEIEIFNNTDNKLLAKKKGVKLTAGNNNISIPVQMKSPRLWWCNGMGDPALYDFKVSVRSKAPVAKIGDSIVKKVGVRTIEVVREDDTQGDGRSFYFKLNGEPVFVKGANYIPCDNFLPRVDEATYRRTIADAADANMNMLRVWGGGIYENDVFYELCDSMGIMIWQDFMFACSLYPAQDEMLENIRQEAVDNVKRLRSHPCLALWCGNNECHEAWYKWGWKERYERMGLGDLVRRQYLDVYHDLLPDVVNQYSPHIFYWPSSPYSDIDRAPEAHRGDYHLWTVWGGSQPIDLYNTTRARFFSEYGFQSFPELETIRQYAPDSTDYNIDSDVMLSHQRAGADANRRLERYLLEAYPAPRDFESFVYMTQILQGDAVKTAIKAHRRDKPYCMGTMFWQHNDCWPVASWSSRDYYGRWKAVHYFTRELYRDIMLSVRVIDDYVDIHVVSDRPEDVTGSLTISTGTLTGDKVNELEKKIHIEPGGVVNLNIPLEELTAGNNPADLYLYTIFTDGHEEYADITLPRKASEMNLPEAVVTIDVEGTGENEYIVTAVADKFVRALGMSIEGDIANHFDNNYFDMLPGQVYNVRFTSTLPLDQVKSRLKWKTLASASMPR